MKEVAVTYSTGGEVLNAYWGFLSHGGLILEDGEHLREGEAVALDVTIESSQQQYRLLGHVVRGQHDGASERTIVAFAPGDEQEMLLSAAWAETDNVPPRKHPRIAADVQVRIRYSIGADEVSPARLLNISLGGCCLRLSGPFRDLQVASSKHVFVLGDRFEARGIVRWARASILGIQFDDSSEESVIQEYLERVIPS